jgi:cellobiose phosphorylase
MRDALIETSTLISPSGMRAECNANGSLRRFDCEAISLALFLGNEIEGGPTNLYLRRQSEPRAWTPLLGPRSPTRFRVDAQNGRLDGIGEWQGLEYAITLLLARSATAWFWHLHLRNLGSVAQELDVTYAQDLALAPYGAVRLNEYYVSQYIDHTPLRHPDRGYVIASRQNLAADGRYPWACIGSLREGVSFATDALQLYGLEARRGAASPALSAELPGKRLQHEHSMIVLRDAPLHLGANQSADAGFFGCYVADHPDATAPADLERVGAVVGLVEAAPVTIQSSAVVASAAGTHFSDGALLETVDLDVEEQRTLFGSPWRHEELDEQGRYLSFFYGADRHVVLRAKELRVLRPHGHILRTGRHTVPDESALTSTVWMSGVFHSMLTQGHVSINRFLSTVHGYLGFFRSHGQRVFVEIGGGWRLLDVPSAFEMAPEGCRWVYRHAGGIIEVRSEARSDPHEMTLSIEVSRGEALRFLISHHVAVNGDDGSVAGVARWRNEGSDIVVVPAPDSELGRRFPHGSFRMVPMPGTEVEHVGGDELLFTDARSRQQPYVCIVTAPARSIGLRIRGDLVPEGTPRPLSVTRADHLIPVLTLRAPEAAQLSGQVARLADIAPWYTQNALVHYLAPRGLEQYSGGGWGTRDVCQGPVEMLLALGRTEPLRDLLLRVMAAQNPDGDWPQWFMFFERERGIRAGDSHGDVVFWPLLVLAQYLIASGDAALLGERVRFFDARGVDAGESATVWQHVQRALALITQRVIPDTALISYGHGDWNDALQPADPVMRDHMCSAWTVTLHYQTLTTLARALRAIGRAADAVTFEAGAQAVLADFRRLLLVDGVLAGYALFEDDGRVRCLLHPSDTISGVRYSALAMVHAILEDMLTPAEARTHLGLIDAHLSGPDGLRLFDHPMSYHGGPQRLFQRAESATFFGREIGLMYVHAHLRYAQALAHMGEAERFFRALCQANPIGMRLLVPMATLRQANCYYSSSDAEFADRYQASAEYARIRQGSVALDGGWRVYSSGAGIALGLIMRRFLGLSCDWNLLAVDPVIPPALDGLRVETQLLGRPVEISYRIGRAGRGVQQIALNGQSVAFTRAQNPHRPGAAQLATATLLERSSSGRNTLAIEIG